MGQQHPSYSSKGGTWGLGLWSFPPRPSFQAQAFLLEGTLFSNVLVTCFLPPFMLSSHGLPCGKYLPVSVWSYPGDLHPYSAVSN